MICDRCGVRWGHKPGCTWPQIDDDDNDEMRKFHDESDEDRTNDYDEVHNPIVQQQTIHDEQLEKALLDSEASPAPQMSKVPDRTPDTTPLMVLDDSPESPASPSVFDDAPVGSHRSGGSGVLVGSHRSEVLVGSHRSVYDDDVPVGSKPTEALL